MKKTEREKSGTKKLGAAFYVVLLVLTAGVLGMLAVWLWTKNDLFLYLMLGLFPVYLFHLIFNAARSGKAETKRAEARSAFLLLLRSERTKYVYVTYLGSERRLRNPSERGKDYLVECYDGSVPLELLKQHLWYDLPPAREDELALHCVGGTYVPYPRLSEIAGKTVLVQAPFFRAAENSPLFREFFSKNEIVLYGE